MKQKYIGYKVPKTLNYNKLEVCEDLSYIPQLIQTQGFYYIFYNETNKSFLIPQKTDPKKYNMSPKELKEITLFKEYLKSPITKEEIVDIILPLAIISAQKEHIFDNIIETEQIKRSKELELRLRQKAEREYERTKNKLSRKYKVEHLHKVTQ